MKRLTDWIEQQVIRLARKLAPADRADWLKAMAAEIDHAPPARRLRFAAGCLMAALQMRVGSPGFVQMAARGLLVAGAAGWALLNIRFAGQADVADMPGLQALAYSATALFAAGGLATARRGFNATIALAGPLLLVAGAITASLKITLAPTPASHLLLALLVEHLTILLVAVAIALAAQRLGPARPEQAQ